jgi:uncharacterized protein (TIGR03435 family)
MRFAMPVLVTLLAGNLWAQSPAAPRFEVASVKANRSDEPIRVDPLLQPGGRVFAINVPLRDLIRVAYGLQQNQLIGSAPLLEAMFDVEARTPSATTREDATSMLRALLTERFSLKSHAEMRQLPVYTLERVNATRLGPQIRPSGSECAALNFPSGPGAPPPPPPPPPELAGTPLDPDRMWAGCPSMFFPGGFSARRMDMFAFSVALARIVRRPVLDKTGLSGPYDLDVMYATEGLDAPLQAGIVGGPPDGGPAPAGPPAQQSGPALFEALRNQLGLRLEGSRAPVEVLVVDQVRQPAEN